MRTLTSSDHEAVRDIIDCIGAPVTIGDQQPDGRIRVFAVNVAAETFYGVPASAVEGKLLDEMGLRPAGRAEVITRRYRKCIEAGESLHFRDFAPVDTAHGRRWVHTTMSPLIDEERDVTRVMATIIDVTELKRSEEELADLLTQALSGFIPICASCKKIRSEKGQREWEPVEQYISERSTARFSHTMCPSCAREWYGSLADE